MGIKEMERIKDEVLQSKGDIRRKILRIRDGMAARDRIYYDAVIRERVLSHRSYCDAQAILAYASYRSEVDTRMLIEQALADGKHVFLPKVSGNDMEFWQIMALEDLQSGYRGIPEPAESVSFPEWMTGRNENRDRNAGDVIDTVMMWMPGAVFDRERHRIGYGKGYYDRYLSKVSDGKGDFYTGSVEFRLSTAALAYDCQIMQRIPFEEHDIRPDMVITEAGINSFRNVNCIQVDIRTETPK